MATNTNVTIDIDFKDLTSEERQQLIEYIKGANAQEKKTITSSKESFLIWLKAIPALYSITERVLDNWENIQQFLIGVIYRFS